jgi:hypothetical protein
VHRVRKFGATASDLPEYRETLEESPGRFTRRSSSTSSRKIRRTTASWNGAISTGSDFIVTGDKNLLRPGQYDSVRILKVSDFLEIHDRGTGRRR